MHYEYKQWPFVMVPFACSVDGDNTVLGSVRVLMLPNCTDSIVETIPVIKMDV